MEFIKGDDGAELELEVKDIDGIVNLSGASVTVIVRDKNREMTKTANVIDADAGICSISFTGDDLQNAGYYSYQGKIQTQEGKRFSSEKYYFEVKD